MSICVEFVASVSRSTGGFFQDITKVNTNNSKQEGWSDINSSVGFWDALFGEKVIVEVPMPDGSVKKVQVTKKWIDKMEREGKIEQRSQRVVKVNILDPIGGMTVLDLMESDTIPSVDRVEYWTVGEQISHEQWQSAKDPDTGELFLLVSYQEGSKRQRLIPKGMWEQARAALKNL